MSKKTLKEYISTLDEKELKKEYNKIPKELQDAKNKEEMIECIIAKIMMEFTAYIIILTDEENKQLSTIKDGKKTKNISERLINSNFILEENGKYYMPEELEEIYEKSRDPKIIKDKASFPFAFYMSINGILSIDKMLELMKETGIKITKKQALEYAKEMEFIVKDNIIYLNKFAVKLDEKEDLNKSKQELPYKVFTIEEMLATQVNETMEKYDNKIKKIISKTVKNKKLKEEIATSIYNMIKVGYNYKDNIEQILSLNNISLPSRDLEKLFNLADERFIFYPTWELNGYAEYEINEESDYDYDDDDDEDNDLYFDLMPEEIQVETYLTLYLSINGIIEIDRFIEILKNYHNINITKQKLTKYIKEIDDVIINKHHIHLSGLPKSHLELILKAKKEFEASFPLNPCYKVIDDIEEFMSEQIKTNEQIDKICEKYGLTDKQTSLIKTLPSFGAVEKEPLKKALEDENVPIPSNKEKALFKELEPIIKKVRVWGINGYKISELNSPIKKEKIGRNSLCPCGSGKKYKKCCGK